MCPGTLLARKNDVLGDLVRYVGFTPEDSRRLMKLRPHAAPELPAIADEFYAGILASESARVVLGDPRRAIALRRSLVRWMDSILAGPHDEALVDLARAIGHAHVGVAAPPRYVIGSMACIRSGLLRVAGDHMRDELVEVASSVSKILDIECALMMDAYAEHWLSLVQREERAQLKRVQSRLEDVEWAFEQSAETANMLVIGLDQEGHVVLFNATASAATGIPPDQALGRDAFEMLFGEASTAVRDVVLASSSVPPFLELTVRARDGEFRTCRFYVSRHVPWGEARPTHLLTAIDWEEERRAQRAERHRARLGAIGNLGSGFAHEIRNPLNGAMLTSMVLQRALQRSAAHETLELARAVDEELRRIKRLTDDFLAFVSPIALVYANVPFVQARRRARAKARPGDHRDRDGAPARAARRRGRRATPRGCRRAPRGQRRRSARRRARNGHGARRPRAGARDDRRRGRRTRTARTAGHALRRLLHDQGQERGPGPRDRAAHGARPRRIDRGEERARKDGVLTPHPALVRAALTAFQGKICEFVTVGSLFASTYQPGSPGVSNVPFGLFRVIESVMFTEPLLSLLTKKTALPPSFA
jgi:PAS domain S-box-containing protein